MTWLIPPYFQGNSYLIPELSWKIHQLSIVHTVTTMYKVLTYEAIQAAKRILKMG